jgi:hypothetical protein
LAAGAHQITASYGGDTNNLPVTSSALTQTAGAVTPATGYWWNPAESGRGFVIEVQGATLFMAGFLYDVSGRATWVASTGTMTSSTQYSGSLITYTGGQTLTGAYQPPALAPSLGTISINFTANNQGTITWPGGTVPIERFDIVAGGSSTTQPTGTPQAGWWWNPAESGRGFAFEVQGGQVYLAGYMYDTSGNPIWYLATGAMTNIQLFQGVWQLYGGGQTLTGPYVGPSIVTPDVGGLTLQFTDTANATLTLPGGRQIQFTRFLFAGPINPIPATLWNPTPGSVPTSGNYVYLTGQSGDYIIGANTYTYTQANSLLQFASSGDHLGVTINGDLNWTGDFLAMAGISQLKAGYYSNLTQYPYENPQIGGLNWYGDARDCDSVTGWFVVDDVTYTAGVLTAVDLRFQQLCQSSTAPMNGQIHWNANDATAPPGPVNPVPANLWQPPAGSTPASGSYVYLQSDAGDYIGDGQTLIYTTSNSTLTVAGASDLLTVAIANQWMGDFLTMNNLSLQAGYYPNLERWPYNNPVTGGLSWAGESRGCNTLSGWFAIDDITLVGGNVATVDLRFEQHCEGATPALHGQIHWVGH